MRMGWARGVMVFDLDRLRDGPRETGHLSQRVQIGTVALTRRQRAQIGGGQLYRPLLGDVADDGDFHRRRT